MGVQDLGPEAQLQVVKAVMAAVCEATSTYARGHVLWSFVNASIKVPQTSLILLFRGSICEPRVIRHGTAAASSESQGRHCTLGTSAAVMRRQQAAGHVHIRSSRSGRVSTARGAPVIWSLLILKQLQSRRN